MMKKPSIIFLLFLCTTYVYAEEVPSKNTISGGISMIYTGAFGGILPGLNIEYERLLHNNFALAVGIGGDGFLLPYADLYARWYPWAGMFFADFGLGIWRRGFETWVSYPMISPGIGWKIDIGKPNGWNLIIGIAGRIFFYEDYRESDYVADNTFTVDITAKASLKVGYSF
jgi:hypothetical protein